MSVAARLPSAVARSARTGLGALGVVVVAATLLWAAGPVGLIAAGVVIVTWYWLSGPYVAAVGHIVALPFLSGPSVDTLVAFEAGFVALVAAPLVREQERSIGIASVVVSASVLGGIAWTGWHNWEPRWLAALAVVGLTGLGLYSLHRYTVVLLELQGVERPE